MNLWLLLILVAAAFLDPLTGSIANRIYDKKEVKKLLIINKLRFVDLNVKS